MTRDPNAGLMAFLTDLKDCIETLHSPSGWAREAEGLSRIAQAPEKAPEAILTHGRGIAAWREEEPMTYRKCERGLWVRVDWRGDTCDTCKSEIPPQGECYGFRDGTLQCVHCGPDRRTP